MAVNWLAAIVLGGAGLMAWLWPVDFLGNPDLATPVVVGSFAVVLWILINAAQTWMRSWSATTKQRGLQGLVAVVLVMQLVVAWNFVDVSRADAFYVRTQSLTLARGSHQWATYFMIYPNNVNFTLLEAAFIKVITGVVASPWVVLNGLRFLWIDTALLSGCYLLRRWHRGRSAQIWLVVFWLLSVPVYAYGLYAYTDALVMPIALDSLAILVWALRRSQWQKWLGLVGTGVLLAVGVAVKTNLIVFEIALILVICGLGWQRRITWRTAGGWLLSLVITLAVVGGLFGVWRQRAGFRADPNVQLPATSWMAMSLNPDRSGQYNHADFESVNQQPTAAAKKHRTQTMLSQRLNQLGAIGLVSHWAKKMRVLWATGDLDSFKLTTQWIRAPRWYRTHQRNVQFWLVLMTQAGYLVVLIKAALTLIKVPQQAELGFIALTILGLTAFHGLFWEVEPRYALPLLPGLLLLSAMHTSAVAPWSVTVKGRNAGVAVLIVLAGVSLMSLWRVTQRTNLTRTVMAVQGNGRYVENMTMALKPGQSLTRTIRPVGPSNHLQLSAIRPQTGTVAVQIEAENHVIVNRMGTPKALNEISYPTTTAKALRLTITNVGRHPVRYGVVNTAYNPQTGKLTAQNQNYWRYVVSADHDPQKLSPKWVAVLVVLLGFGGASGVLIKLAGQPKLWG